MTDDEEVWRAIPGLPGYEASTLGRIRSLDRTIEYGGRWGVTRRIHSGRVLALKEKPNGAGGIYWSFYTDGGRYAQVNRSVCSAFHGPPPSRKHEAAHLDGDSGNNRPGNLVWATPVENASHKVGHGTVPRGSINGRARLSEDQVAKIIEQYAGGDRSDVLAERFGVSLSSIVMIARGVSWRHVPSAYRDAARAKAQQNMAEARRAP